MLIVFSFALLGLMLGSFGSVLVTRLPAGKSIGGRSRCSYCGSTLHALELIPVLSFLCLRGRCRTCRASIAWMYPLLEVTSALLFALSTSLAPTLPQALLLGCIFWSFLLISIIDARTEVIPDGLNIFLALLGILSVFVRGSLDFLAPLVGVGLLAVQWIFSRGRWVGSGDVFLMVGISLVLPSVWHVLFALFVAYITGATVAIALLVTRRATRSSHIPLGPHLLLGALCALLVGSRLDVLLGI